MDKFITVTHRRYAGGVSALETITAKVTTDYSKLEDFATKARGNKSKKSVALKGAVRVFVERVTDSDGKVIFPLT